MVSSILYPPDIDPGPIAEAVRDAVAQRLQIDAERVTHAMALSNWTTIEEMIAREFTGPYRGYYPKCGMALLAEAVIAEVFDQLAFAFDDPRRALRSGIWTAPSARTGGRSDG